MPAKEQAQSEDKETAARRTAQPAVQDFAVLAPQPHLAASIQRTGLVPRVLAPSDVLQLQRMIGNQAVERIMRASVEHSDRLAWHKARISYGVSRGVVSQAAIQRGILNPNTGLPYKNLGLAKWYKDLPTDKHREAAQWVHDNHSKDITLQDAQLLILEHMREEAGKEVGQRSKPNTYALSISGEWTLAVEQEVREQAAKQRTYEDDSWNHVAKYIHHNLAHQSTESTTAVGFNTSTGILHVSMQQVNRSVTLQQIRGCVSLPPEVTGVNVFSSEPRHAEMGLLHTDTNNGPYSVIGVSKECCVDCAGVLEQRNQHHTRWSGNARHYEGWIAP